MRRVSCTVNNIAAYQADAIDLVISSTCETSCFAKSLIRLAYVRPVIKWLAARASQFSCDVMCKFNRLNKFATVYRLTTKIC